MNIYQALVLGIVEGLTEFLPISSTAHLIFASNLLKIAQSDFIKLFEVFIQAGAILSVIILYAKYIFQHAKIAKKVIVSFIPTAIIGFLLYKIIKVYFFENYFLITCMFILVGLVFIAIEFLIKKKKLKLDKQLSKTTFFHALIIGLAQSLAVIPGVSRSGIVMVAMMSLGDVRKESAIYSFLLAIPTIIAASFYDLYKSRDIISLDYENIMLLTIGFISAFITAYISMKWFISFLQNNTLMKFAWYRILLGIILFVVNR